MNINATHPGDPVNEQQTRVPKTHSKVPMQQTRLQTHRFGEYSVHMVMGDTIKEDIIPYRHSFDLRTFALKAPLMQNIQMRCDYYNVPIEAILPFNWEIIMANPTFGDDVPDNCNTTHVNGVGKIVQCINAFKSSIDTALANTETTELIATLILRYALVLEMFMSQGSLLAECGCKLEQFAEIFKEDVRGNYVKVGVDKWIQYLIDFVKKPLNVTFTKEDGTQETFTVEYYQSSLAITWNNFLEKCRQNLNFEITEYLHEMPFDPEDLTNLEELIENNTNDIWHIRISGESELKFARLFAYQIICAHFYSNDQIDPIYSADQYRKLISFYVTHIAGETSTNTQFQYNGVDLPFDWCSAHFTGMILGYAGDYQSDPEAQLRANNYLTAVFSHRRSLRKVDYFTGGRTLPLAVGDNNIAVVSNQVNVIDITKSIQMQRYRNAVQRVGRKIEDYLEGIFQGNKKVAYDYHNPAYLVHTNDTIYGEEVENTANKQEDNEGYITTNLRGNSSKFMFEFRPDRPGIIMGITYFDIDRLYTHVIERDFFHLDRFEEFNPMMQYIGDQAIYRKELGVTQGTNRQPFAYTMRYMEDRQMINEAIGGAMEFLPGWSFKDRPENPNWYEQPYIGSEYIRSKCWELDQFYTSLTGSTLANYFHFIIKHNNEFEAYRPMAYSPGIL